MQWKNKNSGNKHHNNDTIEQFLNVVYDKTKLLLEYYQKRSFISIFVTFFLNTRFVFLQNKNVTVANIGVNQLLLASLR